MPGPLERFAQAHKAARDTIGATLFTVSITTDDGEWVTRAYTSHEEAYPTGGLKRADLVEPVDSVDLSPDRASIEANFPESALIISLGCTAAVNVSLAEDGKLLGAVNIFDVEGRYTAETIPKAREIAEDLRDAIRAYQAGER
ncbi:MAG: hypothetical protein QM602_09280 [Microbacterium sp.]